MQRKLGNKNSTKQSQLCKIKQQRVSPLKFQNINTENSLPPHSINTRETTHDQLDDHDE